MARLEYMITIISRETAENYISYFKSEGVRLILKTLAKGTASDEMLKYLGLGETEKLVLFSAMRGAKAKVVLEHLAHNLGLKHPGTGIAFTIPIDAVCGMAALDYLSGSSIIYKEDEKMEQPNGKHELVMAIANRGHIDTIMDAARSSGARGGTVIHAVGTGMDDKDEKFFGVSIGTEKDLVMIVVDSEMKQEVMKVILTETSKHPNANCILFSLPISGIAGIGGARL